MAEVIEVLELIGTIAFAISGALVAIGANLDLFGVMFLGSITAVGGGILRDLILGINPPTIFSNYHIYFIAMGAAVVVFIFAYIKRHKFDSFRIKIENINNIFDAIGLAAFSVTGSEVALMHGFYNNGFLVVLLGMITGVGGGIFRDILADTTPYVLKKHIYALASIFGSLLYFVLRRYCDSIYIASFLSMPSVIIIRVLATKYCWSLPKIKLDLSNKK